MNTKLEDILKTVGMAKDVVSTFIDKTLEDKVKKLNLHENFANFEKKIYTLTKRYDKELGALRTIVHDVSKTLKTLREERNHPKKTVARKTVKASVLRKKTPARKVATKK